MDRDSRVAVVTGVSVGIGAATARRLSTEGFDVVLGARRVDMVREVADEIGGRGLALDVRDPRSIESFAAEIEKVDVLVNNAGLAKGLSPLAEISDEELTTMWETNVAGLVRVTRALLPKIERSTNGHIVNLGSIASFEVYQGGGGYTASKHAVTALSRTLRLELLGKPIRVTQIDPGLVETEFSMVRFSGDADKAKSTYKGLTPLTADDIADCIAWAVTRPPHVDIDEIVVRPVAQASVDHVDRSSRL
ncbi:MAG TPA: SDR family NAD(P)-dependent oxidoreductase [Actinomycetota bacterium]|nr:SDR family NAD(P)-dependent oxidoreductase [Actinomycetota bacterium]